MTMSRIMQHMLSDLVALFFPNYCIHCKTKLLKQEEWLCTTCFVNLPQIPYDADANTFMAQKLYGEVPILYAFALYKFRAGNAVQHLIHHLKYKNSPAIGEMLGKICGTQLVQNMRQHSFDSIIPVPLHPDKIRHRGYNQSDYFAKGLAIALNLPWYNQCIHRIKKTATQTKKNKIERMENLQDAFLVVDIDSIRDQHVLLVDDVITTGATIKACAAALFMAGVKKISVVSICIA